MKKNVSKKLIELKFLAVVGLFRQHPTICNVFLLLVIFSLATLSSCRKFLDVDPPPSKIPNELVFQDETMATSALVGVYIDLYSGPNAAFANGGNQSTVTLAGLSADEFKNNINDPSYLPFQNNAIDPSGGNVAALWRSIYASIYQANAMLEGLESSTTLTTVVKNQLKGEALFIRAFCYFYLVNYFGDVPLAVSTNYEINNALKRSSGSAVYERVKADLITAEELLADNYVGTDRIRANKSAATALLSRVYLYTRDMERAEDKATKIIDNTGLYSLPSLNNVFLAKSKEAIWQLRPSDIAPYTNEGFWFSVVNGQNVLREDVMSAFELGDAREAAWTISATSGGTTVYLPYKYKRYSLDGLTNNEYSMVLRLAEIYLIRAEARAQQNRLSLAIADIDEIRDRAGLPLIQHTNPNIRKEDLMLAIEQERRVELLAEWGHRWFDLKRWNRAQAVLSLIKPGWSNNDLLYPIPAAELNKNPNLKPQNEGY